MGAYYPTVGMTFLDDSWETSPILHAQICRGVLEVPGPPMTWGVICYLFDVALVPAVSHTRPLCQVLHIIRGIRAYLIIKGWPSTSHTLHNQWMPHILCGASLSV